MRIRRRYDAQGGGSTNLAAPTCSGSKRWHPREPGPGEVLLAVAAVGLNRAETGYTLHGMTVPGRLEPMKRHVYERLADGRFKPEVARTFAFDQVVEAYRYLESQQVGKVVITS